MLTRLRRFSVLYPVKIISEDTHSFISQIIDHDFVMDDRTDRIDRPFPHIPGFSFLRLFIDQADCPLYAKAEAGALCYRDFHLIRYLTLLPGYTGDGSFTAVPAIPF